MNLIQAYQPPIPAEAASLFATRVKFWSRIADRLVLLAICGCLVLIDTYIERHHDNSPDALADPAYSYLYYPEAEVYYAPERRVYFWFDGSVWRSDRRVPTTINLQSPVPVDLDSPEPYRQHAVVRAMVNTW